MRKLLILIIFVKILFAGSMFEKIILEKDKTIYSLKKNYISLDSLIWEKESIRYTIDNTYGRFILLGKIDSIQSVKIFYNYSDLIVPKSYDLGIKKINSYFDENEEKVKAESDNSYIDQSNVITAGSIFRQIQVSTNGQSSLNAGMDLKISGKLTPKLTIVGAITDNSTPYQSYSSTQSLQEINKIYLILQSEKTYSQIGDIDIRSNYGYWNKYNRKLMGASTEIGGKNFKTAGFFGGAKGTFQRQKLETKSGDQGPYRLLGKSGESSIVIIPGSESVYLNGEKLSKEKYMLYYQNAEIFFSSDVLVSEESRIFVEFNYKNETFPQTSFGGYAERSFLKNSKFWVSAIREKQDENNPTDVFLSQIDSDSLRNISNKEIISVSTAVKDSSGDYILADSIWVFNGRNNGDYSVYFYRENVNGGYVRCDTTNGYPYFKYAPNDPASQYYPRRFVNLPTTHLVSSGGLSLNFKKRVGLNVEWAYSSYDKNNFNENKDNSGAVKWDSKFVIKEEEPRLSLQFNGWMKNKLFRSFDKLTNPDFERNVGYTSQDTITKYFDYEFQFEHKKFQNNLSLHQVGATNDSLRSKINISGIRKGDFGIKYNWSQLIDKKLLPYQIIKLGVKFPLFKKLKTTLNYDRNYLEPIYNNNSNRSEEFTTGFHLNKFSIEHIFRDDFRWDDTIDEFNWYSQKNDIKVKYNRKFSPYSSWYITASYRDDRHHEENENFFLTQNRFQYRNPKWGFSGNINTNINRTSEAKREAVFDSVGTGYGQYSWDDNYNRYVFDDLGEYRLRYELTNERIEQYVHKSQWNIRWQKEFKIKIPIKFSYNNRTNLEFKADDLRLYSNISTDKLDSSLHFGSIRFKNNFKFRSKSGKKIFSIFIDQLRMQNARDINAEKLQTNDKFQYKYRIVRKKTRWDFILKHSNEIRETLPIGSYSIKINRQGGAINFQYSIFKNISNSLELEYQDIETDFNSQFNTDLLVVKNEWNWNRKAGELIFASITYSKVWSDFDGIFPYEVAQGRPIGASIRAIIRYEKRISEAISVNGLFQYRKRGESDPIILGKVEVRAYF